MGRRGAQHGRVQRSSAEPGEDESPTTAQIRRPRDSTRSATSAPRRARPAISTRCPPCPPTLLVMAAQPPQVADHLIVDQPAEHVLRLTLNRPDKLNAMHNALEDDIGRVLDWFEVRSVRQGAWTDAVRPNRRSGWPSSPARAAPSVLARISWTGASGMRKGRAAMAWRCARTALDRSRDATSRASALPSCAASVWPSCATSTLLSWLRLPCCRVLTFQQAHHRRAERSLLRRWARDGLQSRPARRRRERQARLPGGAAGRGCVLRAGRCRADVVRQWQLRAGYLGSCAS